MKTFFLLGKKGNGKILNGLKASRSLSLHHLSSQFWFIRKLNVFPFFVKNVRFLLCFLTIQSREDERLAREELTKAFANKLKGRGSSNWLWFESIIRLSRFCSVPDSDDIETDPESHPIHFQVSLLAFHSRLSRSLTLINSIRVPVTSPSTLVVTSRHAQALSKQSLCTATLIAAIVAHAWSRFSTFIEMVLTRTSASMQLFVFAARRLPATIHACWLKRNYIQSALSDRPKQHQRRRRTVRFIIRCRRVTQSPTCAKKTLNVGKKLAAKHRETTNR